MYTMPVELNDPRRNVQNSDLCEHAGSSPSNAHGTQHRQNHLRSVQYLLHRAHVALVCYVKHDVSRYTHSCDRFETIVVSQVERSKDGRPVEVKDEVWTKRMVDIGKE
jgi:hypothetical protein